MVHVPAEAADLRRAGHEAARSINAAVAKLVDALTRETDPRELSWRLQTLATELTTLAGIYSGGDRRLPKRS